MFKPAGVPACSLEEVVLTVDELEALRLADLVGMYQEQAAGQMKISRPTFGRIIESARRKVAEAIVQGKALKIEGGVIQMAETRGFTCHDCQHAWEAPFGTGRPQACPACKSQNIHRAPEGRGRGRGGCGGRGRCHRGGRGGTVPQPETRPETKE
jgi:predicted DNA-binding protein (UPF0251 family)